MNVSHAPRGYRPLEVKLPEAYWDALNQVASEVAPAASPELRKALLLFFFHRFLGGDVPVQRVRETHLQARSLFPEARGSARCRVSLKVSARVFEQFQGLQQRVGLNKTEILKTVVYAALVNTVQSPDALVMRELQALSFALDC
jgi:hypothetical protein